MDEQIKMTRKEDFFNLIKHRQEISNPVIDCSNKKSSSLEATVQTICSKIGNDDLLSHNYLVSFNAHLNEALKIVISNPDSNSAEKVCFKENLTTDKSTTAAKDNSPFSKSYDIKPQMRSSDANFDSGANHRSAFSTTPNFSQPGNFVNSDIKHSPFFQSDQPNTNSQSESSFPPKNTKKINLVPEFNPNQFPQIPSGNLNQTKQESSFPVNNKNSTFQVGQENKPAFAPTEIKAPESSYPPRTNNGFNFPQKDQINSAPADKNIKSEPKLSGPESQPFSNPSSNNSFTSSFPPKIHNPPQSDPFNSNNQSIHPRPSPFASSFSQEKPNLNNLSSKGSEIPLNPSSHNTKLDQPFRNQNLNAVHAPLNQLYPNVNEYLLGINTKKSCVVLYENNTLTAIPVNELTLKNKFKEFSYFNKNCSWIQMGNSLFVSGGETITQIDTASYILTVNQNKTIELDHLPNMYYPRDRHSLVYIEDKHLILASGGVYQSSAEIFDLNTWKWKKISNLNHERMNSTSFYYNNRFVYLAGGAYHSSKLVNLNSIEVLDTNYIDHGFSLIDLSNYSVDLRLLMGVIRIDKDKFLLFGGIEEVESDGSSFELGLNPETGKVDLLKKSWMATPNQNEFKSSQLLRVNNEEIAAFNSQFEVPGFNFKSKEFRNLV